MLFQKKLFIVASCCLCLLPAIDCSLEEEQELIEDNFDQWMEQYFNWLTDDQKAEMRDMKKDGYTIDDFLPSLNDMYDSLKGEALGRATEGLNRACLTFIDYLTEESKVYIGEFEKIAQTAYEPYTVASNNTFVEKTRKRLTEIADHLISNVKDKQKQQQARKFLPSCVKVFLASSYMIRHYNDHLEQKEYLVQDSDIEKWRDEYLYWLSDSEIEELKTVVDEGATFHELRIVIGNYYVESKENRLVEATKALYDGCSVFAEYLFGDVDTAVYLEFFEEAAVEREKLSEEASDSTRSDEFEKEYQESLQKLSSALMEEMPAGFKRNLVRNYFDTCVAIFDRAYRMKVRMVSDHDEL
uniref:Polyprotein allergen nematode domain-containing protein n=1 Tax=Plectus sambesii TaxID=2011161 RepID=A0A914X1J9_9BILA